MLNSHLYLCHLRNYQEKSLLHRYVEGYEESKWVEQGHQGFVHVMDAVWSDKGHALLVNALQEIAVDRERW